MEQIKCALEIHAHYVYWLSFIYSISYIFKEAQTSYSMEEDYLIHLIHCTNYANYLFQSPMLTL